MVYRKVNIEHKLMSRFLLGGKPQQEEGDGT